MKFKETRKRSIYKLPQYYDKLSRTQVVEVRDQYIKEQEGLCVYCKSPLRGEPSVNHTVTQSLYPRTFFEHPIHLHHNHQTGLTIGAVHAKCNAVLWEYHGE